MFRIPIFFLILNVQAASPPIVVENPHLTLPNGTVLKLRVKRPSQSAPRTLPAVLLFGGFNTGGKAIDLVNPEMPVFLATFEYPFEGPRKFQMPRDLKYVPKAKQAMHDTVAGIHALVDWVAAQPGVDPQRITLVGASLGAPFVSIVAGENKKVSSLILVHGFADVPDVAAFSLAREWKPQLGFLAPWAAKTVSQLAWWYIDLPAPGENLKKLAAHQRVLLFTADQDDLLPLSTAENLRGALKESDSAWEEKLLPGFHLRAGEDELIKTFVSESIRWLK